jgi:hypothetical protein
MKKKKQFMRAVQILAPDDQFIFEAAQRIPEEKLPAFPGAAALEFVVGLGKLLNRQPPGPKEQSQEQHHHQPACMVKGSADELMGKPASIRHPLTLPNALRVKGAEFWLKLGQPDQAIIELGKLPNNAQNHPWALRVHLAAIGAAREMNCQAHAE